jgi:hypothetical protein
MARLALCLQVAYLLDQDAVDFEERRDAVLATRRVDGRHGRRRHCFDGRLQLWWLRLDGQLEIHRCLVAVCWHGAGRGLWLGCRKGWLSGDARGRGCLAVLRKLLLVGGRWHGLRKGRARVGTGRRQLVLLLVLLLLLLERGCGMASDRREGDAGRAHHTGLPRCWRYGAPDGITLLPMAPPMGANEACWPYWPCGLGCC